MGPFLLTQQLRRAGLIGQPGGISLVATISSLLGSISFNGFNSYPGYAYRASKAALNIRETSGGGSGSGGGGGGVSGSAGLRSRRHRCCRCCPQIQSCACLTDESRMSLLPPLGRGQVCISLYAEYAVAPSPHTCTPHPTHPLTGPHPTQQ